MMRGVVNKNRDIVNRKLIFVNKIERAVRRD